MLGVGTLLAWLLIGESRTPQDMALSRADTGAKKFYDFQAMGRIMTLPVALFLLSTCLATFGTQGYDNSFNYYIRDVFSFPPSYNGYIKASTGLVALAANFTLNLWILRRFSPRRALLFLLPLCGVTLLIRACHEDHGQLSCRLHGLLRFQRHLPACAAGHDGANQNRKHRPALRHVHGGKERRQFRRAACRRLFVRP